jgi:hypothetical protein
MHSSMLCAQLSAHRIIKTPEPPLRPQGSATEVTVVFDPDPPGPAAVQTKCISHMSFIDSGEWTTMIQGQSPEFSRAFLDSETCEPAPEYVHLGFTTRLQQWRIPLPLRCRVYGLGFRVYHAATAMEDTPATLPLGTHST